MRLYFCCNLPRSIRHGRLIPIFSVAIPLLFVCGASSDESLHGFIKPKVEASRPAIAQLAKLTASDGHSLDLFGSSVSISGNTIAVGAYADGATGAVYVFVKPADGWHDMTETAKLTPSDSGRDDLGGIVAIAGNTVVAGANGAGSQEQGAGYVFVEREGGWQNMTQTAVLTASDGKAGDAMESCGINASGNAIVASTPAYSSGGVGRAYVYQRPKSGWQNMTQTAELTSTDGKYTGFGAACNIGGNTVVVGAPGLQAVYVFVEPGGLEEHDADGTAECSECRCSGRFVRSHQWRNSRRRFPELRPSHHRSSVRVHRTNRRLGKHDIANGGASGV